MEQLPLSEADLDTFQAYCDVIRAEITKKILAISAYLRDNPGNTDSAKAFDCMNNAAMFVNATMAHIDYAHQHLKKGIQNDTTPSTDELITKAMDAPTVSRDSQDIGGGLPHVEG